MVRLKEYAAAGWPDLRRGMPVTVERPWRWDRPLESWLAWRIRAHSSRLSGHAARASHAMIYLGNGRCASQDSRFRIVPLRAYRGCVLRFWRPPAPGWPEEARNRLVAECMVHRGAEYGYRDILGLMLWSLTGWRGWLGVVGDPERWICSESVCSLIRSSVDRSWAVPPADCLHTPQSLEDWMQAQGYECVALRLV